MPYYKKIEDNELYLYMNGQLIYKRWLDTGYSKVFDIMAYDKYTLTSICDLEFENPGIGLIPVNARLKLYKTEDGGRQTGILSGYRPNHVFEYDAKGKAPRTFIGDVIFEGSARIEPGETRDVIVRFLMNQPVEPYLNNNRKWWLQEGAKVIGAVQLL